MCKGPAVKLAIGLLLVLAGIYAILPVKIFSPIAGIEQGFAWEEFATVVIGSVPALVILLGLMIVWIELEEIKIEQEERKLETEESERRTTARRGRRTRRK